MPSQKKYLTLFQLTRIISIYNPSFIDLLICNIKKHIRRISDKLLNKCDWRVNIFRNLLEIENCARIGSTLFEVSLSKMSALTLIYIVFIC